MDPVVVIGGGLSGLACGFELARAGVDVRVVEGRARAGGVVGTEEVDGFRFESGPNTVPAWSAELLGLAHELGLDGRLVASLPEARDRFLYMGGRLRALPRGPLGLVTTSLLSARGKLAVATEPLRRFRPPADGGEPDVGAFLSERIGAEATRTLAGAFVRGVYAAELGELGARSAFPELWRMACEHGGLVRGMLAGREDDGDGERRDAGGPAFRRGALVSFRDGFGELVDALARSLGERLLLGRGVEKVERDGTGWAVTLAGGERLPASRVVLAVGAKAAARLLEPVTDGTTVVPLGRVRHARVTLVHQGFAPPAGRDGLLPQGFGYLVPPGGEAVTGERAPRVLGTIFASNLFAGRAPEGGAATTSFYRTGDVERELGDAARDERALGRLASEDLARGLGRAVPEPAVVRTRIWEDVIPSYGPGHADLVAALEAALARRAPGLVLAGSFTGGVSVEHVVRRGRAVARTLLGTQTERSGEPRPAPEAAPS